MTFRGWSALDNRQGTAVEELPETRENPIKISFPILRLKKLLGYDTREKNSKYEKLIFPCSLQENEKRWKNGVMGSSSICYKKRTYNSFKGRTNTLTLLFKSAKIKKALIRKDVYRQAS